MKLCIVAVDEPTSLRLLRAKQHPLGHWSLRTVPRSALAAIGMIVSCLYGTSSLEDNYDTLVLEPIAEGLHLPVGLASPPGDTDRLFVIEQHEGTTGRIRIVSQSDGGILPTPFLELKEVTDSYEEGLLGFTFHPHFHSNGFFYVYYTTFDKTVNPVAPHRASRLVRYRVSKANPDRADPSSAFTILTFPQATPIHNGGWMSFGSDEFLYLATGDGSAADKPSEAAQAFADDPRSLDTKEHLMGRILRIDVNADDFPDDPKSNYAIPTDNPYADTSAPETWIYGLRNPWRVSLDRETGDIWLGDVGSSMYEEINYFPAGSAGSRNFGWPAYEGEDKTGYSTLEVGVTNTPIVAYPRTIGACVTGGFVYRGESMPWLRGHYFHADYAMGWVRSFRYIEGVVQMERDWTQMLEESLPPGSESLANISAFAEDSHGELYLVDLGGQVYKVTQSPYNLWRNTWFSPEELEDAFVTGREFDADDDGLSNQQEFVNGSNPLLSDSERMTNLAENVPSIEVDESEASSEEESAL